MRNNMKKMNRPLVIVFMLYCFSYSYILIPGSVLLSRLKLFLRRSFWETPFLSTIHHSLGLLISLLTCGSVRLSWGVSVNSSTHSSSIQCRVWHLRSSEHTKIAQWILSIFRRRPRSDFVTRAIVFCASKAIISISIINKWTLNGKPPLGLRENDSRYLETFSQRWRTGRWRHGKLKKAIYRSRGEPHTIFEPEESGIVFMKSLAEVGIY